MMQIEGAAGQDVVEDCEESRRVRRRCEEVTLQEVAAVPEPDASLRQSKPSVSESLCDASAPQPLPTPCRGRPTLNPLDADQVIMKSMPVCFEPMAADVVPFKIVCYGDSLTAGFYSRGRKFEPYGRTLSKALGGVGIASSVSVCGLCAKTAQQLVEGLRSPVLRDYLDHEGQGLGRIIDECHPDLVLIMAGTNDLTRDVDPQVVFGSVTKLHAFCHQRKLPTVSLIPPVKARGAIRNMQQRLASLLIEWARTVPEVVAIYDVEKLVPRKPTGHFWDTDEIHLNAAGQCTLGERLGERLACLPVMTSAPKLSSSKVHSANLASGGQKSNTLTALLASKKTPAHHCSSVETSQPQVVIDEETATDGAFTQHKPLCNDGVNEIFSTNADIASKVRSEIRFREKTTCVGLGGRGALSAILSEQAEKLLKRLQIAQIGNMHATVSVGLSLWGDRLGGWTGDTDIFENSWRESQGDAILKSLEKLANHACAALVLNSKPSTAKPSSKTDENRSGWCAVDNVAVRLHIEHSRQGYSLWG